MIRVAMLSKWHVHAGEYAGYVQKSDIAKITVVWDEDAARGKAWAEELGVDFEPDLAACLAREDVDAVICDAPTTHHKEVLVAAAKAGKHIFTEKMLATNTQDAEEIAAAVREAGVKFCISMPQRTFPHHIFAKQAIERGLLGKVTMFRMRNAHDGSASNWLPAHFYNEEETGGGAMMDLGAHSLYLCLWMLGMPESVSSVFTQMDGRGVDDNAVTVCRYADGALAIHETGFVSRFSPPSLELYGTKGSLFIGGPEQRVTLHVDGDVSGFTRPDRLPAADTMPVPAFLKAIAEDTQPPFGMEDALALTRLVEAAYVSHKEGKLEKV